MRERIKTRPDGSSYMSYTEKVKNPMQGIKEAEIGPHAIGKRKLKPGVILRVYFPEKDECGENLKVYFVFTTYEAAQSYYKNNFQKEPVPEWEWV